MSEKKFMSYGDAETIFTGYANEIKNKVDWESNGVLGAKNLLHIDNVPTNVASSADDENGISIITTSTGAWGYLGQFNAKANVRYTINATVCGYGRFAFSTSKSTFPDNALPTSV